MFHLIYVQSPVLSRRTLSLILSLVALFPSLAVQGSPPRSQQQAQRAAADPVALELKEVPLERDLKAGQKHDYRITLAEGQYANVTVEQRGIDVVVRLMGPDGKQIAESDSESRLQGRETVELVAEAAGSYGVSIEAKQAKAADGAYAVRLTEVRPATQDDRSLQEARRLAAESVSLRGAGKYSDGLVPRLT